MTTRDPIHQIKLTKAQKCCKKATVFFSYKGHHILLAYRFCFDNDPNRMGEIHVFNIDGE